MSLLISEMRCPPRGMLLKKSLFLTALHVGMLQLTFFFFFFFFVSPSGANDGMGFPFLFLAVYLLSEDTVGEAIGKWFYLTWLFQILLSCVIGLVVGYVARKILQWSERQ
jgi:hypothetical protein